MHLGTGQSVKVNFIAHLTAQYEGIEIYFLIILQMKQFSLIRASCPKIANLRKNCNNSFIVLSHCQKSLLVILDVTMI